MEKYSIRVGNNGTPRGAGTAAEGLLRSSLEAARQTGSSDFALQWGNRKRLRCMKVQVKDDDSGTPAKKTTARVDRRVVRSDQDPNLPGTSMNTNYGNSNLNLRRRPWSPPVPPLQRVLR